jgi:hypothetical protein
MTKLIVCLVTAPVFSDSNSRMLAATQTFSCLLDMIVTQISPRNIHCMYKPPREPMSRPGTAFRGREVMELPEQAVGLAARGRLSPRLHSSRRPAPFNLLIG